MAYRFTGRRYLLNFAVGFFLLGLSFYIVAFALPPDLLAEVTPGYEWPRLIVQTAGFGLVASAYYGKKHRGETMVLLSTVSVVVVLLPVASEGVFNLIAFEVVDKYFFVLTGFLAFYVFTEAVRGTLQNLTMGNSVVIAGFASLAIGQYTLALWALDSGVYSAVIAQLWRILGLSLFTVVFLLSRTRRELRNERH